MTSRYAKYVVGALAGLLIMGAASSASAETRWERLHPRRDEVIDRLHHENLRIHDERREGDLTYAQAHRLHVADRAIFRREQFDARHNGGHITLAEQRRLNWEENRLSHRIGQ